MNLTCDFLLHSSLFGLLIKRTPEGENGVGRDRSSMPRSISLSLQVLILISSFFEEGRGKSGFINDRLIDSEWVSEWERRGEREKERETGEIAGEWKSGRKRGLKKIKKLNWEWQLKREEWERRKLMNGLLEEKEKCNGNKRRKIEKNAGDR